MSRDEDPYSELTTKTSKGLKTPEDRQSFRLRSLVAFLILCALIIVFVTIYSIKTTTYNTPPVIMLLTVFGSAMTTVLGSIIGTSLK